MTISCIQNKCIIIFQYIYIWQEVLKLVIFFFKPIIQGLLWLYNKDLSSNLTKIKAVCMASTSKVAFNIDGQTIHLTFNIHVQQTLTNLSNLSSNSLNRFTCWYEQLQLDVIDEISL